MAAGTQLVEVDPNGDTLIILKNPDTALLEWKDEDDLLKEMNLQEAAGDEEIHKRGTYDHEEEGKTMDQADEVRFLVSSRQMRIVSPYFDNIFKWDYIETLPRSEDGLYHIQAQQWSAEAIAVILNISHQKVKAIPKDITPALFAQILIAADYYQLRDVLEIYVEKW